MADTISTEERERCRRYNVILKTLADRVPQAKSLRYGIMTNIFDAAERGDKVVDIAGIKKVISTYLPHDADSEAAATEIVAFGAGFFFCQNDATGPSVFLVSPEESPSILDRMSEAYESGHTAGQCLKMFDELAEVNPTAAAKALMDFEPKF